MTVQSNTITIKVVVSIDSLKQLINMYQKTGDINKSTAADLKDCLDKVSQEIKKHSNDKAINEMKKFIELLAKGVRQSQISTNAKDILTIDANAEIHQILT